MPFTTIRLSTPLPLLLVCQQSTLASMAVQMHVTFTAQSCFDQVGVTLAAIGNGADRVELVAGFTIEAMRCRLSLMKRCRLSLIMRCRRDPGGLAWRRPQRVHDGPVRALPGRLGRSSSQRGELRPCAGGRGGAAGHPGPPHDVSGRQGDQRTRWPQTQTGPLSPRRLALPARLM